MSIVESADERLEVATEKRTVGSAALHDERVGRSFIDLATVHCTYALPGVFQVRFSDLRTREFDRPAVHHGVLDVLASATRQCLCTGCTRTYTWWVEEGAEKERSDSLIQTISEEG